MKTLAVSLLFILVACTACSSQNVTEMRYTMEIEAIDPDDVPHAAETADILKERIEQISARKDFTFERSGNTTCTAEFKTSMPADAVEMLLTATGEVGFYELYTGDKLLETADLLYEAAVADSVNNPGLQDKLLQPWPDSNLEMFHVLPTNIDVVMQYLRTKRNYLPKDAQLMKSSLQEQFGDTYYIIYLVRPDRYGNAPVNQSHISKTKPHRNDRYGYEYLNIEFDNEGTRIWRQLTYDNIGKPLAVVMDGVVVSAPTVQSEIEGGKMSIAGNFDYETLEVWSVVLNTAPLKLPVSVEKAP